MHNSICYTRFMVTPLKHAINWKWHHIGSWNWTQCKYVCTHKWNAYNTHKSSEAITLLPMYHSNHCKSLTNSCMLCKFYFKTVTICILYCIWKYTPLHFTPTQNQCLLHILVQRCDWQHDLYTVQFDQY